MTEYAAGEVLMLSQGSGPPHPAVPVSVDNPVPVSVAALPLPSGGATSALQTAGNTSLSSIATNTTGLPTAIAQAAGNTILTNILTKLGAVVLGAGAAVIGGVTQSGSWVLSAGAAIIGRVGIDQTTPGTTNKVSLGSDVITTLGSSTASTTGGTSTYAAIGGTGNALLTNSAVAAKASAGSVYGFDFVNTGTADAYVQIFDVAQGSVTLGTTVPKMFKWVPAGGAWSDTFPDEAKISFATAITVAATTTPTGSTAPATGILANILFK